MCAVCGIDGVNKRDVKCGACAEVADLCLTIVGRLFVICDGSYDDAFPGEAGAGLVLAWGNPRADFLALCACRFRAPSSTQAELGAIRRAALWAPGALVLNDCDQMVAKARRDGVRSVVWLRHGARKPNHHFAHRLAQEGRLAHRAGAAS